MKNREKDALPAGRVRDLARQAFQNEYMTHTGFLSLSDQSDAAEQAEAAAEGGVRPFFYGGMEEAERRVLFFLPSYLEAEEMIRQEEAGGGVLACIQISVRGARFTKEIGHRDCLGALMHLGIGRDQVGDILINEDGSCAFVYVLSSIGEYICRELATVGRAHVDLRIVPLSDCGARPVMTERSGSVASVRIDSLIAMVFRMSRSAAQELITSEMVFADGRTVKSVSFVPAAGCRVSVRGHGKFVYEGEEKKTRKGRLFVRASVYS